MKKVKGFPPSKIKAYFDDPDIDVTFEAPQPSPNNVGWARIWQVADVYVHKKGKDHDVPNNQVDTFPWGITLEVLIPDNILKDPDFKDQMLYLIYFDKKVNQWVKFKNQPADIAKGKAVVRLYEWIKDPPVGWGMM
jgi:hypothetical protein